MDTLDLLKTIGPYVSLVATAVLAVLGWFAKDMILQMRAEMTAYREAMAEHGKKVTDLRVEFLELQAQLPREFTLRDDHLRHMTVLERKIDDLREDMRESLTTITGDVKVLLRETPKRKTDES